MIIDSCFLTHWTADPAQFSLEARRLLRMLGHPYCGAWNQSRSTRIHLDNTHQGVELRCLVNFSKRIQASWLLRVSLDSHSCASHLCGGNCNVGQGTNSGMLLENAGMIAKMRCLSFEGVERKLVYDFSTTSILFAFRQEFRAPTKRHQRLSNSRCHCSYGQKV